MAEEEREIVEEHDFMAGEEKEIVEEATLETSTVTDTEPNVEFLRNRHGTALEPMRKPQKTTN